MSLQKLLLVCMCAGGIPFVIGNARIVGGNEITIDQSPYTASLQYLLDGGKILHICGGTIIHTKFILTAATCNPEQNIINFYARVGSTFYDQGGQVIKVGSFIPHPEFQISTLVYNVAIVTFSLEQEINLGPNAAIIPLTTKLDHGTNSLVSVTGWGYTDYTNELSRTLKEVKIPIYNFDECKKLYPYLNSSHICIGGFSTGACHGDAGGPVVHLGELIALVSGGRNCFATDTPGLYTRISAMRSWIKCVTGL